MKRFHITDELRGEPGSEARAIIDAERATQRQREENLRQHAAMRESSRRATIAHKKAEAAANRAQEAASWCNPMRGAFDIK